MKIQELRIGNIVSVNDKLSRVLNITTEGGDKVRVIPLDDTEESTEINPRGVRIEDVEGVEITGDILQKFSFEIKKPSDFIAYKKHIENHCTFYVCVDREVKGESWVRESCSMKIKKYKAIHQIQNLVHALTGEELTFSNGETT